ncbi:MAG: phosphatidate cytidylyltransferase [Ileibacterium sp.]|nr:phosphatidate cytidylyltransferase [Ileibacterium sp.]
MKKRVLTAIAIILFVLPPVAFGGWLLEALGVFIVMTGCWEWLHVMKGSDRWIWKVYIPMVLWILGLYFLPLFGIQIPTLAYWIAGLIYFWSLPVFMESFSQENCMAVLSLLLIFGVGYLAMQMLMAEHKYLWTLIFATYGSDTGAFFAGKFFGKHKMNPRISPKKTWEGFAGGWIAGFVLSFAVSMLYSSDMNPQLNLWICILAPVFAELGDLCFSSYKRALGLKDFSNLLPGHGGVLDRIDSLMMNFLLFGFLASILL